MRKIIKNLQIEFFYSALSYIILKYRFAYLSYIYLESLVCPFLLSNVHVYAVGTSQNMSIGDIRIEIVIDGFVSFPLQRLLYVGMLLPDGTCADLGCDALCRVLYGTYYGACD